MARRTTNLAALDIAAEALAQQDGLAERLARNRAAAAPPPALARSGAGQGDHNAWRKGKALLQVALPEEAHMELSILAKRRRITLSHLVKDALNQWLDRHGHTLRLPD
jgi:hypothetical protein